MAWARRQDKTEKTVPHNYAVTREQKRFIANKRMEEEGRKKFRKQLYQIETKGAMVFRRPIPSDFSKEWRDKWQEEA